MPATYDDAALVVQLARWGTELGLQDAAQTIFADTFNPTLSSVDDPAVRKLLSFSEVIGTLVKQSVLDRELVLDLWWITGFWKRLQPAAERERRRLGEPRLYENIQALAESAGD